jgi:hypothetical protein
MPRFRTFLLIPALASCYAYHRAPSTLPPPGEHVRITLNDSGTALLAAQVGPSTEALSGRMLQDSAGSYLIAVSSTRRRDGVEMGWRGERVAVSRPFVVQVEERRFSRTRTVLASAAVVVAVLFAREAFWGPGGVFGGAPPGGGPGPR